ncbi:MAG: hypothetical protein J6B71_04170 [Clostridia bacterium]|nr:hypothetical protein [Clostridia bacterium]
MKLKVVCLFLAMILLIGAVTSCQDQAPDQTSTGDEETHETSESGEISDDLPDDVNYQNREVKILAVDNTRTEFEADGSQTNVDQALFERNANVESRFGVILSFDTTITGGNTTQDEYVTRVENSLMSNTAEFDLFASYSMCGMTMALKGWLMNLEETDSYINFQKPWWPKTLAENLRVGDSVYFASGDIALSYYYAMMFILGNMDMMDDRGITTDPRQEVLDGTWTVERMFEYTTDIYEDVNNSGTKDGFDIYGYIHRGQVYSDMYLAGSNFRFIDRDESGKYVLGADSLDASRGVQLLTVLSDAFATDYCWYGNEEAETKAAIAEGRGLFLTTAPAQLIEAVSLGMNYSYAILPTPKYDENQDHYYTNISFTYTVWSVPQKAADPACSTLIMEALAAEGYRNTTYAFYETNLKYRYASDDSLNTQMFEILRSYPYFEITRACFDSLATNPVNIFRQRVANRDTVWTSTMRSAKGYLEEFVKLNLQVKSE